MQLLPFISVRQKAMPPQSFRHVTPSYQTEKKCTGGMHNRIQVRNLTGPPDAQPNGRGIMPILKPSNIFVATVKRDLQDKAPQPVAREFACRGDVMQ